MHVDSHGGILGHTCLGPPAGGVRSALTNSHVSVEAIRLEGIHHFVPDDDAALVLAEMATACRDLSLAVVPCSASASTAPPPGARARSAPCILTMDP